MHLPHVDKHADIESFFSLWDPRVKIVSLSFLILSIALLPNLSGAFCGFIISITFAFLSKIPFSFILKQLRWIIFFVGLFIIIISLITPGGRIYFLSLDGLKLGILIGVRATSICILISLITGTARFHTTLKAISKLGVPNKLVQLLIFTYRYIFVFVEEARKMLASAKARGFRKKTNIYTLKIIANLVGMLFIRGIEQTQSIYNAMISRGYKGDIKICDEFKLSVYDLLKAFLVISLALALHL